MESSICIKTVQEVSVFSVVQLALTSVVFVLIEQNDTLLGYLGKSQNHTMGPAVKTNICFFHQELVMLTLQAMTPQNENWFRVLFILQRLKM